MTTLSYLVRIVSLVFLVALAPLFVLIRRIFIFCKENFFDFDFLSKIEMDMFSSELTDADVCSCNNCPFKHHSTHGYKPVLYRPIKPFILLLLVSYIAYIKGHISKTDFITYLSD